MIRAASLLFVLSLTGFCQSVSIPGASVAWKKAAAPAPFTPTNMPGGISAAGWWEPSRGYVTNGGIATLQNLTSIGTLWDLTNKGSATSFPIKASTLNSLAALNFLLANQTYVNSENWTSAALNEIVMYVAITNVAGTSYLISSYNNTFKETALYDNAGGVRLRNNTTLIGTGVSYNKWMVLDMVWNGLSSAIYTNLGLVISGTTDGGSSACSGLILGQPTTYNAPAQMTFAGMVTFTNQILDAIGRSNIFYYWTNRFGPPQ